MNGLRSCSKTRLRGPSGAYLSSFLARLSARQARDDALARAMCFLRAARSAESTAARGPSPVVATGNGLYAARPALVRGGWRPEAAFGGVGSAERYWRRDRASLGRVCRPSARGCADIATLPALARPFFDRCRRSGRRLAAQPRIGACDRRSAAISASRDQPRLQSTGAAFATPARAARHLAPCTRPPSPQASSFTVCSAMAV